MNKLILATLLLSGTSYGQTMVNGYIKTDGTYVAPHVRSSADSVKENNYGYKPSGSGTNWYKSSDSGIKTLPSTIYDSSSYIKTDGTYESDEE